VKLPSWNIQHGGGTRRARIVEEISAYDSDVIALTEFRARPGVALSGAVRGSRPLAGHRSSPKLGPVGIVGHTCTAGGSSPNRSGRPAFLTASPHPRGA
jgi:hypothetical protein